MLVHTSSSSHAVVILHVGFVRVAIASIFIVAVIAAAATVHTGSLPLLIISDAAATVRLAANRISQLIASSNLLVQDVRLILLTILLSLLSPIIAHMVMVMSHIVVTIAVIV